MRAGRSPRAGGGGAAGPLAPRAPYSVDGLLSPRVEDFAHAHDGCDADEVVTWLR